MNSKQNKYFLKALFLVFPTLFFNCTFAQGVSKDFTKQCLSELSASAIYFKSRVLQHTKINGFDKNFNGSQKLQATTYLIGYVYYSNIGYKFTDAEAFEVKEKSRDIFKSLGGKKHMEVLSIIEERSRNCLSKIPRNINLDSIAAQISQYPDLLPDFLQF